MSDFFIRLLEAIFFGSVLGVVLSLSSAGRTTSEQKRALDEKLIIKNWGTINSELICPHCQTKGKVHAKPVKIKKGVSGAKATGAILTGGLSLLATGLSRKEDTTQEHCENCNSTWLF
jgi:hypothetical protein